MVVDVGDPDLPFVAEGFVISVWGTAYRCGFDPAHPDWSPPRPREMADAIDRMLERLRGRKERGLEPVFQLAPTGKEADKGRKPRAKIPKRHII